MARENCGEKMGESVAMVLWYYGGICGYAITMGFHNVLKLLFLVYQAIPCHTTMVKSQPLIGSENRLYP